MIKIGKVITKKNPKNVYKIKHDWMLGDSDGDTTTTQIVSSDNKDLDRFLYCLTKLEKPLPGVWANILETDTIKKCLKDDYAWFYQNALNERTAQDLYFETIVEQGHTFVSYQGYSIRYFDENGIEHSCEYISTEDWREQVINETLNTK